MIDFRLYGEGPMTTVFRLTPLSDRAKEWVEEHVDQEGFQPSWPEVFVEHGYIDAVLEGINLSGLTIHLRAPAGGT